MFFMYVCMHVLQGGVYYAVPPSPMPGVQQIVYSVSVDSSSGLLHGIAEQTPTAIVHVSTISIALQGHP